MKTVEIIGYNRANLGKKESNRLRLEGNVPCVLYGGEKQVHFYSPMILFRELVYTPDVAFVNIDIEGTVYRGIIKDVQFHPVSEVLLHADFLELHDDKPVRMNIPVKFVGTSPGVVKGGTLIKKRRTITVSALPKDMPGEIELDISKLDFGRSIKVAEIEEKNFTILDNKIISVAVVEVPRALRGKTGDLEDEAVEGEEEGTEVEVAEGDKAAE